MPAIHVAGSHRCQRRGPYPKSPGQLFRTKNWGWSWSILHSHEQPTHNSWSRDGKKTSIVALLSLLATVSGLHPFYWTAAKDTNHCSSSQKHSLWLGPFRNSLVISHSDFVQQKAPLIGKIPGETPVFWRKQTFPKVLKMLTRTLENRFQFKYDSVKWSPSLQVHFQDFSIWLRDIRRVLSHQHKCTKLSASNSFAGVEEEHCLEN